MSGKSIKSLGRLCYSNFEDTDQADRLRQEVTKGVKSINRSSRFLDDQDDQTLDATVQLVGHITHHLYVSLRMITLRMITSLNFISMFKNRILISEVGGTHNWPERPWGSDGAMKQVDRTTTVIVSVYSPTN